MIDVVLLGFGGPESRAQIRPFLDGVLAGRRIPTERYEEVVAHYEFLGGRSPFNELTRRQAKALADELQSRGIEARVQVAYRHSEPFIENVAQTFASVAAPIAVILAAHQSEASWDKYYGSIPGATYTAPFYEHPLFIEAHAERIRKALESLGTAQWSDTLLVFTAHSIPQAMADRGPYVAQLQRTAQLIANRLENPPYRIAYQSRSGSPSEPWLQPDVRDVIASLPESGIPNVVVAPIGFLCDHVEVLYDLDVDAAAVAARCGVRIVRATSLNDHPLFIRMLADLVQQCLA